VPVPIHWLERRRLGRLLVGLLVCAASAGTAVAASAAGAVSAPAASSVAAPAAPTTVPVAGGRHALGKVTFVGASSFTIQTHGRRMGMINALTASANAVTVKDYPYVWGGGHGAAGVASAGLPGPGHNGTRIGYDCSGAVAAVLARVGLWAAGSQVPNDAGVISVLLRQKLIAPGPANAPDGVTLYDHPGVHIFMNINGRFWGTSDGGAGANPRGGAGWLSDEALDARSRQFKQYHLIPSVLKNSANYGQDYTFQFLRNRLLMLGLLPGDAVRVGYAASGIGTMNAMAIDYPGARTATGTVVQVGLTGTSLTLMSRNGSTRTYQTGGNFELVQQLALGDVASVTYTTTPDVSVTAGAFVASASAAPPVTTAHSVQLKAAAGPAQVSGTVTALAAAGASFKLHTASGTNQTFATAGGDQTFTTAGSVGMLRDIRVGDAITVSFVQANGGVPIAERVQLAGPASQSGTPEGTTPPTTTPAATTPIAPAPTGATPIGR
jgi:hypothetical protein